VLYSLTQNRIINSDSSEIIDFIMSGKLFNNANNPKNDSEITILISHSNKFLVSGQNFSLVLFQLEDKIKYIVANRSLNFQLKIT
jgi:hypothetical protein